MIRAPANTRGGALLFSLGVILVVQGLLAVFMVLTLQLIRDASSQHFALESRLVVASVLAEQRLHFATAGAIPEGMVLHRSGIRPDGWHWDLQAERQGSLAWLTARVERPSSTGQPLAAAQRRLILWRTPSDTLNHTVPVR